MYKLTDFGAARELAPEQEFMSIYGTEEYLVSSLICTYPRANGAKRRSGRKPGARVTNSARLFTPGKMRTQRSASEVQSSSMIAGATGGKIDCACAKMPTKCACILREAEMSISRTIKTSLVDSKRYTFSCCLQPQIFPKFEFSVNNIVL